MADPVSFPTPGTPPQTGGLRAPNMLAVASGKGGVGKTWFSITLCQALAKLGKKVLLFDADLGLANVDIQLGLIPERDLGAVVDGNSPLSAAVTKYATGGYDILAGRSGTGSLASMASQRLLDMRSELVLLAQRYDLVLLDLGAGVERPVMQMAGSAAMTLVVVTDEPTSLTDAYAFIKLSRSANPKADLRIVVNMAATHSEGGKIHETIKKACESFLQYSPPLVGVIRRDVRVRDAIRAQTPLLTRSPVSDAAQDVEAIARTIAGFSSSMTG